MLTNLTADSYAFFALAKYVTGKLGQYVVLVCRINIHY